MIPGIGPIEYVEGYDFTSFLIFVFGMLVLTKIMLIWGRS